MNEMVNVLQTTFSNLVYPGNTVTFERAIRVLNINKYPCTHYFQISSKRFIWVIMVQATEGQVSVILGLLRCIGSKRL